MKQENLLNLLFELIKNSKRSDRDLAKILKISQPTVTRLRKVLEKDAIAQYTVVPKLPYLDLDILVFTFARSKELVHPLWDKGNAWAKAQPNVMFVSTGQGAEADMLMISIHRDYADFVKFYHIFRRDWGKYLEGFKTFVISLKGSVQLKSFSFNYLVETCKKEEQKQLARTS